MGFGKTRGPITIKTVGKVKFKWVVISVLCAIFQKQRNSLNCDLYNERVDILDLKQVGEFVKKKLKKKLNLLDKEDVDDILIAYEKKRRLFKENLTKHYRKNKKIETRIQKELEKNKELEEIEEFGNGFK